jgi:methylenetetrahydrofolate reductase (NADPH)
VNFLEIVPKKIETFAEEVKAIQKKYPSVTGINVPDILSLKHRSEEAAEVLLKEGIHTIPHFRSVDRTIDELCALLGRFIDLGLKEILLVAGDKPQQLNIKTYSVTPAMAVQRIKSVWPQLKVYCGLDQYRESFKKELDYCEIKKMAGCDGFFTQPFFDVELARIYLEQLGDTEIFVGHCPVTNENSKNYWKTKNNAIFPKNFELNMESNCELANQLIGLAKKFGQHTYMMPILAPIDPYLSGVST